MKNAFALQNGLNVIHLSGNVNNLDNSSSLDCATQQTSRPSTNPNSSLMAITTTSSITSLLESTSSDVTAEKKTIMIRQELFKASKKCVYICKLFYHYNFCIKYF